jgi:hypothetical protein
MGRAWAFASLARSAAPSKVPADAIRIFLDGQDPPPFFKRGAEAAEKSQKLLGRQPRTPGRRFAREKSMAGISF